MGIAGTRKDGMRSVPFAPVIFCIPNVVALQAALPA